MKNKKNILTNAFLEILKEKPIKQITVREIVQKCGVNRNTFYYYFEDIPSLVEELVTGEAERLIELHPGISSLEELLDDALEFILEHKTSILHLYRSAERSTFEVYLMKFCRHTAQAYLTSMQDAEDVEDISEEDYATLVDFISAASFGLICQWLASGMEYDAAERYKRMLDIFKSDQNREFLKKVLDM